MRTDLPFRGSRAVASGELTRGQLTGPGFRHIGPGMYVESAVPDDLRTAVLAAVSRHPGAVVVGTTAAALLGAVESDDRPVADLRGLDPVELTRAGGVVRARSGVRVRREHLELPETSVHELGEGRVPITTPVRTAFDVARRLPTVDAVVVIEALGRRHGVGVEDVRGVAAEHPHARGLVRLWAALALVDDGARAAFESRVRVALLVAGLPAPVVGHCVLGEDGRTSGVTDLAWPEARCALLCDRDADTAACMAGWLAHEGWRIHCVSPEQWGREAGQVVERAGHMLRACRRRHRLERSGAGDDVLGLRRPRRSRPRAVRVFP